MTKKNRSPLKDLLFVGFEVFTAVVMKRRVQLNGLYGVISQKVILFDLLFV
jgi:hypothetical protein